VRSTFIPTRAERVRAWFFGSAQSSYLCSWCVYGLWNLP
jgi:hypothetical protein